MEKLRQQRKAENSFKPYPSPQREERKLKIHSQNKPDGPGDRLAILISG
jgi:hypothetical protein